MRKNDITYEKVAALCNELTKNQEKISVREIHKQLGGSFSNISKFLKQWQEQSLLAQKYDSEISDELMQAIKAEMVKVADNVKASFVEKIDIKDDEIKEMEKIIADFEKKTDELEFALSKSRNAARDQQLSLEKALSSAQSETKVSEKRIEDLQAQVDELRTRCHEADIRAAVAETKVKEYERKQKK